MTICASMSEISSPAKAVDTTDSDPFPASIDTFWSDCLEYIGNEVSSQVLTTWFSPITPSALQKTPDGALQLDVPSQFYKDWLRAHHHSLIQQAASEIAGRHMEVQFSIDEAAEGEADLPSRPREDRPGSGSLANEQQESRDRGPAASRQQSREDVAEHARARKGAPDSAASTSELESMSFRHGERVGDSALNEQYTFGGFIRGDCNELAYSAAMAISESPLSSTYNPFLIYGGVGLGKTHLVQAIGNAVQQHDKNKRIYYTSSENFTSQFVRAIQRNEVGTFSDFYRHIDVLIVDDVQFFGGKEKTQEEFFHIFNALHQRGGQLVLSADRAPREISGIEERLLSRFRWGLTADVQPPDLETRTAILQHKAEVSDVEVPHEVISFIAQRVTSNIRSLEGALNRLLAYARLNKVTLSVKMARAVLRDIIDDAPTRIEVSDIQEAIAQHFELDVHLLSDKTRKRYVAEARQLAMYFCKQFTDHTLKEIGLRFGGRDHSTVIHACKKIEDLMETDSSFQSRVEDAKQLVRQTC